MSSWGSDALGDLVRQLDGLAGCDLGLLRVSTAAKSWPARLSFSSLRKASRSSATSRVLKTANRACHSWRFKRDAVKKLPDAADGLGVGLLLRFAGFNHVLETVDRCWVRR
jgi:hypothetical protein